MKKVVVTGANGFIGKNLCNRLLSLENVELHTITRNDNHGSLLEKLSGADVVFHLAGVNRPKNEQEFSDVNVSFTEEVIGILESTGKSYHLVFSSSTQANKDNLYGRSKLQAENLIEKKLRNAGGAVIYRLPGVFGKWCKPDYNSVVATFCTRIAANKPIEIHDPLFELKLVYIDDVVNELLKQIHEPARGKVKFADVTPEYNITLGNLAEKLIGFKDNRSSLRIPRIEDPLEKKLYSTFLSYLPTDDFSYPLELRTDARGSLFEVLKSETAGQIFLSTTLPGITRGNHYHQTKTEKFCVVSGTGLIQFRKLNEQEVIEYRVTGNEPRVVDIPPGYTHNITNIGEDNMITLFWANEIFDPANPDTYFEKV